MTISPKLGDISRRDKEGLRGRVTIVWAGCPSCGKERWLPKAKPDYLCGYCARIKGMAEGKFENAVHKETCLCQRCKITKGLLTGAANPAWKGGKYLHDNGYVVISLPKDHPFYAMCAKGGGVFEHRLVVAESIGRALYKFETVHHKNGIKTDNRVENFELWVGNHGTGIRVVDYHCAGCVCERSAANE